MKYKPNLASTGLDTLLNSRHKNRPPGLRTRTASCNAYKQKTTPIMFETNLHKSSKALS